MFVLFSSLLTFIIIVNITFCDMYIIEPVNLFVSFRSNKWSQSGTPRTFFGRSSDYMNLRIQTNNFVRELGSGLQKVRTPDRFFVVSDPKCRYPKFHELLWVPEKEPKMPIVITSSHELLIDSSERQTRAHIFKENKSKYKIYLQIRC